MKTCRRLWAHSAAAKSEPSKLAGLTVQTAMLREQLADARRDRDDASQERDHWRDQAQRLALPKPIEPEQQAWWRWLRSTG